MQGPNDIFKPYIIEDETQLMRGCLACLGTHYIKRIWAETELQNYLLRATTNYKGIAPVIQLIKQQKYFPATNKNNFQQF
jgi:hypothetical protein